MKKTSENGSRVHRRIATVDLLALLVAGIVCFAPRARQHASKNAPATGIFSTKAEPSTPATAIPFAKIPAVRIINAPPAKNPLYANTPKENISYENEFRMQADTGDASGETGDDPKKRADYFYKQRAYPFDQTPAGARQQSLRQLDAMIKQQRSLGIIPEEDAAPALSAGFLGPSNWTNIGPQPILNSGGGANFGNPTATGRVTAIAVDPTTTSTSSQVIYLGAATGGVWKSTDGGNSWNSIFDQNNSLAIGGIAIAPSSNTTIYVGTGELNFSGDSYYGAGVYKSTDGGNTWIQQCGGASVNFCTPTFSGGFQGGGFYVGTIAVNPTNANIALAAVRNAGNGAFSGIYRTTDGGTNWNLIPSASGAAGNSIVWNPSDNTVVYATLGERGDATKFGVYKSTDSGLTFTRLTGNGANGNLLPTTNLGRHEMAVAPSNGNVIYVAINAESTSSLLSLAKSTDGGVTWSFTAPGTIPNLPNFCSGQCWYDMALAVLPNDPNTLIVGGSAFTNNSSTDFRTSDGGATWVDITNGSSAVRPHVDTHVLKFAATTGGFRLYTGNDGGVWFTDNPTASPVTWEAGNNANLTITQFYPGHAVHPSDENISYGGTQDNGTEKYSGIPAWDHVTCGDGAWAAIDPNIPTTVYANCQNIAILRSTLDGVATSWLGITNELSKSGDRSLFIPPLVHDPIQSGLLYFGTFRVWQSINYGNDWAPISPDLTGSNTNELTSVSVAPSNTNVVYSTTTDGRVWRTANAGAGANATWTNLTSAPLPGRYATMVRTDRSSTDVAYLSFSGFSGFVDSVGHIFKTTNGGATWTDISGTAAGALPNTPVNDIAVVHIGAPLNFDAVYIATDVGVFECPDPTSATPCTTWSPVGTGLPKVPVVGLAFRQSSATLRAITHGRGVWIIETPNINATGLLLLTSITPSSAASASGSFTMTFAGNDFGVPSGTPQILVDGVDPGVTQITLTNSNQMTATIPASVTTAPGLHQISVNQPGHAASPSDPTGSLTFSVTGPAPTLALISPNHVNFGSATFPLTATGTNFVCVAGPSETLIQFAGVLLTPTACSGTSITVTVPANLVGAPLTASVVAFSPGPGGGNSASLNFAVAAPDMTISKSHISSFVLGQTGSIYTIIATNSGTASTNGTVTVVDNLPSGLTATGIAGTGWTCALNTLTCTRADALAAATSYPAITLTVTVGTTAGNVTNIATVSGGGEINTANDGATDVTTLIQDFNVSGPTSAVTVTAGQTATFTISAAPGPGGFSNAISFSASGLPSASNATFSPTSVTPGANAATTTLSIATTARGAVPPSNKRTPRTPPHLEIWTLALATILFGFILSGRSGRQRRFAPAIFVAIALLLAFGIAGCGANATAPTGTPAGTSTITVTATSGSLVHTTTVTLNVQ
jgi:photosystem II stability/assembly factor-like uncharacterized protein